MQMALDSNEPAFKVKTKIKRNRKLPQKDIVDADLVSPSSSKLMDDLLFIRTPSQHDRLILSELWGNSSKNSGYDSLLPHVSIGKPQRSEISTPVIENVRHSKTYKDQLRETKPSDLPMDLSNITLIPSYTRRKNTKEDQQHDDDDDNDAIDIDYTVEASTDIEIVNNEKTARDTDDVSSVRGSSGEESKLNCQNQTKDIMSSTEPGRLLLTEADDSKDNNQDEENESRNPPLTADSNNINQIHISNTQTNESLEKNNISKNIDRVELEKELVSNIKTADKDTSKSIAEPESEPLKNLNLLLPNHTEKSCPEDTKNTRLNQEQPVPIADKDSSDDAQINSIHQNETSPVAEETNLIVDNLGSINIGLRELEISHIRTLDSPLIPQESNTKLETLSINTNNTPSATFDLKEIENNANTQAAESSLMDNHNSIITTPSFTPITPQEDSRLEDYLEKEESEDDDTNWMEVDDYSKNDECEDKEYEKIFQLMSAPKVDIDSKTVPEAAKDATPKQINNRKVSKRFLLLKNSGSLNWIENGRDKDKKKKKLGMKRKRQLFAKLEKPYIIKKKIKSCWIVD